MKIYNTLSKKIEEFEPINSPNVGLYTCGMTVYYNAHIGHGRKYVTDDILKRTLRANGFHVNHVQNVTDVGHLTSDADEGEDKMEKGARLTGKTVWEVAEFFANDFYSTMDRLNVIRPSVICKATDHIAEQIEMVQQLINRGFAYDTKEAVYFDVSKDEDYGKLTGQNLADKKVAVRSEVETGEYKRNPQDFALWFKRVGRFENHMMHWDSPWGDGFPGWHIECSAMSVKYLGEQLDIHTGGEDHIPVHHTNEIAQSESATGKVPFSKYWLHTAFLKVDGVKMAKSTGNFYTIEDIVNKGYDPLALRYLYLTAHYKSSLNFTWEALDGAQKALCNLNEQVISLKKQEQQRSVLSNEKEKQTQEFRQQFMDAVNNDLNTPQALAVVWSMLKSNIPSEDKYDLLMSFDEVLGFNLSNVEVQEVKLPEDVIKLIDQRKKLKDEGKYEEADSVRQKISELGYSIKDTSDGVEIVPVKT